MGPLLLTILIVLLVGGLAIWGDSRRRGHPTPPCKDRRGATNAKDVPVNLRYGRVELTFLHRYANVHDVELGGRYDIRTPPLLNIWTHNWITPGCRQAIPPDVQPGVQLENGITDIGEVAARLRLGGIPRRTGEARASGRWAA